MVVTKTPAELEAAQLQLRQNNIVIDTRVNTLDLFREALDKTDKTSFSKTDVLELLGEFATSLGSQKKEEKATKKKKSPEEKRPPSTYNLFIRNGMNQLKAKFPDLDRNVRLSACGKIWSQVKEKQDVDFAKMDIGSFIPKNIDDLVSTTKSAAPAPTTAAKKEKGAAAPVAKKGATAVAAAPKKAAGKTAKA